MFGRLKERIELSRQNREKDKLNHALRSAVGNNELDSVVTIVKSHGNDYRVMNSFGGYGNMVYDAPGVDCRPSLCHAAATNKAAMVRALLEAPAIDVNALDPTFQNYSPLLVAVFLQHADVVKALLTHPKVDVNARCEFDEYRGTSLSPALRFNAPHVCDEYDKQRSTALHLLAKQSAKYSGELPDHVKIFLAMPKLIVDAFDKAGWTPLMYAAQAGNKEFVAALIKVGANPDIVNQSGCTAGRIAQLHGHENSMSGLLHMPEQAASYSLGMR